MAIKVGYFNRKCERITRQTWEAYIVDNDYKVVKMFGNGKVLAKVIWLGRVEKFDEIFQDHYPLFRLEVWNYKDGKIVQDPVAHGKTFGTEREAIEAYNDFLFRWTDCDFNLDTGLFVEVGNELAPPPPPDENVPKTQELGECGAW